MVEEHVLGLGYSRVYLQVSMENIPLVHVVDGFQHLVEDGEGFGLAELFDRLVMGEEVAVPRIVQDHIHFAFMLEDGPQLHDVRVLELVVDGDFPFQEELFRFGCVGRDFDLDMRTGTILIA